ncbi:MAG: hypothetical protein ACE5G7_03210 [Candidatus Hydrothermarchaeaceae archaeon]
MNAIARSALALEHRTITIPSISTGHEDLDTAIGGLKCKRIYLLKGGHRHLEALIYNSMIRNSLLHDKKAVYVDCGNTLDPYAIARLCREMGADATKVLKNILISRPFTAYQLSGLLEERLNGALEEEPVLVVFSNLLSLFEGDDVEDRDAEVILGRVIREMKEMRSASYPLLIIHGKGGKGHLARVEEMADTVMNIAIEEHGLKATVEKDPILHPKTLEFFHGNGAQSSLEEYFIYP